MRFNTDICKLVIENMTVIEAAPKVVDDIEKEILNGIGKVCEEFVGRQGWDGKFDIYEDGTACFCPKDWRMNEKGKQLDGYWFTHHPISESYWLSVLLSQDPGTAAGIEFSINHPTLNENKKKYMEVLAHEFDKSSLRDSGFRSIGESLFLPISLDQSDLIKSVEEKDFDLVLGPVNAALKVVEDSHEEISNLREKVISTLGEKISSK